MDQRLRSGKNGGVGQLKEASACAVVHSPVESLALNLALLLIELHTLEPVTD